MLFSFSPVNILVAPSFVILNRVISDIESLTIYAGIHPKKLGLYQMYSKRFPYTIYYDIIEGMAYVVAVLPMRRNPAWILREIKNRS